MQHKQKQGIHLSVLIDLASILHITPKYPYPNNPSKSKISIENTFIQPIHKHKGGLLNDCHDQDMVVQQMIRLVLKDPVLAI